MSAKLTPEEKAVEDARKASRPRRHLPIIAIGCISLLLFGAAFASFIRTGGKSQIPIAERDGPKADPSAVPNKDDFNRLAEKQKGVMPTGSLPPTSTAGSNADSAPSLLLPQLNEEEKKKFLASLGKTPPTAVVDPSVVRPSNPPIDLPYAGGTNTAASNGANNNGDADANESASNKARDVAASIATATTDVYVRNRKATPQSAPAVQDEDGSQKQSSPGASTRSQALPPGLDPANIARSIQKPDADQRVSSRIQQNERFAERTVTAKEPLRVSPAPPLPYLAEGDSIPAVLQRAISTDLPGQIEAVVTNDVYDSFGHGILLVPKGTRCIGVYNSGVIVGQDRLQSAFSRLIFPNGASLIIENFPGADTAGATGIPGDVNNHFFRIFGTALATSAISFAVERRIASDNARNSTGGTVNVLAGATETPGTLVAKTFGSVAERMLDRTSSVGPTIKIEPGKRFNIQINRDIAIDPRLVRG